MRIVLLLASCLVFLPAAQAASLGPLLPRVQVTKMFDVERNSAGGSGGVRADGKLGGLPSKTPPDPEDEQPASTAAEPGTAPEPHRGGPIDRPKPRWKSMMPGALQ
jgi:hypothetical protein